MLRGRIVSADGIAGREASSQEKTPPGCCKATAASPIANEMPDGLAAGRRQMVGAGLRRAAAASRSRRRSPTASASSSATRSPSTCSAATSPPASPIMRTVDWESLGINFVMVFSPQRLPRRAAHPSRHPDLSRRRHGGAGRRHRRARWPTTFPTVTAVRVKDALEAIGALSPIWCWRSAAPAPSRCSRPRWCWAARSPPATATGSMTRSS